MALEPQPLEMAKNGKYQLTMKCSVVILNWNGAAMLRRYLPSVIEHTQDPDFEIVVADNGSTDDSLKAIEELNRTAAKPVRTVLLDKNYGFAEGYNRALQDIDAEYCVLLNSDVAVTAGWLRRLTDYLDAHADVAAVQPKIRAWLPKYQPADGSEPKEQFEHAGAAGGHIDYLGYPFCRGRILSYVEDDHGQYDTPQTVFWTSGACMCVRTRVYKECGGLDDGLFAHMEEIDLCWRMNCRGWQLVCVPDSVVYHLGGGALPYESPRKLFLNFRNSLLMLYKNLPARRLLPTLTARCFLDYVAVAQYLLKGQGKNAWAVIQARIAYHEMLSSYKQKRQENLSLAVVPFPSVIYRRSIIFDWFLRHRRTY